MEEVGQGRTAVGPTPSRSLLAAGAVLGSVVLLALAVGGFARTADLLTPSSRAVGDAKAATYACLERRVEAQVPAGATVHFATTRRTDPAGEWRQRATEGTYPRYRVVAEARAEYVIDFGPFVAGCPEVRVRRAAGP